MPLPFPFVPIEPFPPFLQTPRLILRRYRRDDAADYHELAQRNRAHLERYERDNPARRLEDVDAACALIDKFNQDWETGEAFFVGVFLRDEGALVGQLFIGVVKRSLLTYNLGFFVDCLHEGRGYITEAARAAIDTLFGKMNVHRIAIWCDDSNVRSQNVARRCGFTLEAHLRQDKRHPDGTITGTHIYGRLRTDLSSKDEIEMYINDPCL